MPQTSAENPDGATAQEAPPITLMTATDRIGNILQIIETNEAEPFVGSLFRRKFGGDPPDFPRHFVALYSVDGLAWSAVGYVNFWQRQRAFMCGGLVIEDRAYRQMPRSHRQLLKAGGGIAQILLATSLRMLPNHDVVWGLVGDTQAERVDMKVGFEHTHLENLIAIWTKPHSAQQKIDLANEIATVGPF